MITMPQKIGPLGSTMRVSQARPYTAAAPEPAAHGDSFDKVTLSASEGPDAQRLKLQSKLSQEVRTATTTGTLATLRQQVQAGEYRVDAGSIAKKLLLLGEV